jgi:hypothetical protein
VNIDPDGVTNRFVTPLNSICAGRRAVPVSPRPPRVPPGARRRLANVLATVIVSSSGQFTAHVNS